jgi:glycosyltransferase involved in cell wall biosynthesis
MLVKTRVTNDADVELISKRWLRLGDRLCDEIGERLSLQYLFSPSSFLLQRSAWFQWASIIQLHNLHGGYFSHSVLSSLSRHRPVVWHLWDMWAMTGHCSYAYDCDRWKRGCGLCPNLSDYPGLRRDTTAFLWRWKDRVYRNSRLTIVAPSRWMADRARESPLLSRFPIHWIPNGLDLSVFRPIPKSSARDILGIEGNGKRVILFSAHVVTGPRKGGQYLLEGLRRLSGRDLEDVILLVVGENADQWPTDPRWQVRRIGLINDERLMAAVYSAADMVAVPSLADNMANTILEGMACGVPAICFDAGGNAEAVRHMETGYVARPQNVGDLAQGIRLLLTDVDLRKNLAAQAKEVAAREYSMERQAERFKALYEEILEGQGPVMKPLYSRPLEPVVKSSFP